MITIDPTDDYKNHYVHNSLSKRLDGDAIRPWPDCGFVPGMIVRHVLYNQYGKAGSAWSTCAGENICTVQSNGGTHEWPIDLLRPVFGLCGGSRPPRQYRGFYKEGVWHPIHGPFLPQEY